MSTVTKTRDELQSEVEALGARVVELERSAGERGPTMDELRNSEEKHRSIFRTTSDALMVFDAETRQFLDINDAALNLYGYTREEFLSLTHSAITAEPAESDVTIKKTIAGELCRIPLRYHNKKDGTVFPVEISSSTFALQGRNAVCGAVRDITERKLSEEALQASEKRFWTLVESAPMAVYETDAQGKCLYVNAKWRELAGMTLKEALGDGWQEGLHKEDRAGLFRLWSEHAQRQEPWDMKYRFCTPEGKVSWVMGRATALLDPDGRVTGHLGVNVDITERKRVERDYEMLFREMLNGFALHEIITDARGKPTDYRFLAVNPAFERMTGLKSEDINRKTVLEVLPETEPHWIETYGKVALTGQPTSFESYARELDKHFEVTAFCPAPNHFACIFADVTQRKRAEEELRESEEQFRRGIMEAPFPVMIHAEDGEVLRINNVWTELTGYAHDEIPTIADWTSKAYGQRMDDVRSVIDAVFERNAVATDGVFEIRTKSGEARTWDFSSGPLGRLSDGRRLVISMAMDVTERKRAEEELRQHRDHLEELVEERSLELEESRELVRRTERLASIGTLSAGIAHEINNPLGMIMLSTDAALKSIDQPEKVEKLLRQSRQDVERCARIVKGVLRFARDQSTRKWPLDLNEVVRHTLDLTVEYARKHGVTVETRLADMLHPILANSTEMEQIGINLVHNAVHACRDEGRVVIETSELDDKVRLVIRDNGCGMTAEEVKHVFDPFFTTRQEKGGTGLGLSTVHGIVADHGGTIDVASEQGKGTTFTVDFPRHCAPEADLGDSSGSERQSSVSEPIGGNPDS